MRDVQRSPIGQLAISVWLTVIVCLFLVVDPICYQLSPKSWSRDSNVLESLQLDRQERLYSFGSEQYAMSFYLKKPFFGATRDIPAGSLVFVEQRNLDRFKQEISPNIQEVARFRSGLEAEKKEVVVVRVAPAG